MRVLTVPQGQLGFPFLKQEGLSELSAVLSVMQGHTTRPSSDTTLDVAAGDLAPEDAEREPNMVALDCTQLTFFPALHESLHSEDFLELCRERQVILQELLDGEKVTRAACHICRLSGWRHPCTCEGSLCGLCPNMTQAYKPLSESCPNFLAWPLSPPGTLVSHQGFLTL